MLHCPCIYTVHMQITKDVRMEGLQFLDLLVNARKYSPSPKRPVLHFFDIHLSAQSPTILLSVWYCWKMHGCTAVYYQNRSQRSQFVWRIIYNNTSIPMLSTI